MKTLAPRILFILLPPTFGAAADCYCLFEQENERLDEEWDYDKQQGRRMDLCRRADEMKARRDSRRDIDKLVSSLNQDATLNVKITC